MVKTLKFVGGFVDSHVHLREPGATHKEDFESGTKAALAGGIVTVIDMPNNINPTITPERLKEKIKLAQGRIYSDVGFHYGSRGDNLKSFKQVKASVHGLKAYLNFTTGNLLIEDEKTIENIFKSWPRILPLLIHAEEKTLDLAISIAKKTKRKIHVCHISKASELKAIQRAKKKGLKITCEVTPHHLFLNENDAKKLKHGYGRMKPPLAADNDRQYLLKHIDEIDVLATDHAPHTKNEKSKFKENVGPYGVPGVETSLILMLELYLNNKLTLKHLVEMMDKNPRKIFNIKRDKSTIVYIEIGTPYKISAKHFHSKAGWTPFEGMLVRSRITEVVLRGKTVYKKGDFLLKPSGKII